ncbi:hypothetical protein [Mucilaginibacter sp.]|uniref:hypothetical protein n=1 Tax=Mucilaginibacter sp. TaxID=1882438 RepID=UPI003B000FDC
MLTDGFIISQQTTPEEIISYFKKANLEIRDINNGWKHYSIRNFKVKDTYISMMFFFNIDNLNSIGFIVDDKITTSSWDDWSLEKELNKKDYYEDWLINQIGKVRQFAWGRIDASYDNKSASSSIYLKYK